MSNNGYMRIQRHSSRFFTTSCKDLPILFRICLALSAVAGLRTVALSTTTADQRAVINVTLAAVKARFPSAKIAPTVSDFSLSKNYALTTWTLGEGGGSAAIAKKGKTWSVIGIGGGAMDAVTLIAFGVPSSDASALVAHLSPQPSPSP